MPTSVPLRNPSTSHTLRVRYQDAVRDKNGKVTSEWKKAVAVDGLIPPGGFLDVWLGEGRRVIVDELPV